MYSKIDQIMLGTMLTNSKELGIYSAAVRIAEVFDFIPLIVSSSLLPKLIQWKSLNPKDYLARFQVYVDIMLLFWIICAIPVSLFSEEIVDFLYGSEFQASSKILSIYIFAQFGANLGIARSSFFNIERKLYYSLPICLCGLVVNVLLNLFLIPYYGAMGATAATLITQLFVAVLINFFVKDLRVIGFMIIRSFLVYNIPKRIKKIIEQISK
jgi:PST family polysaccharide transporter